MQVGEHYLAEGWGQRLMTLQRFVQAHILGGGGGGQQPRQQGEAEARRQRGEETEQQDEQQEQRQQRGYLAQHPLFEQIPALAGDIREPPYCCLGEGEVQSVNAWFGPAGTVRCPCACVCVCCVCGCV
jgi:lysine-specific demethylase 8